MTRRAARYICEFTVRTTFEERERLKRFARQTKLSLSRYLVLAALIGPQPASEADRAIRQRAIFHARKIGVNLNQIARALNNTEAVEPTELAEALDLAADALRRLTGREAA